MPGKTKTIRVLFVCLGNICRSPMAEAVFNHLVEAAGLTGKVDADSAGTGGWHAGEPPHRGTIAVLAENGIGVGGKRARQLARSDLAVYDYVVAMDEENVEDIQSLFGTTVHRLLEYADPAPYTLDVPDPYYEGNFKEVYRLVEAGCCGLLAYIRKQGNL